MKSREGYCSGLFVRVEAILAVLGNLHDEDPEIRRVFKEELAKSGGTWGMSKFFPGE